MSRRQRWRGLVTAGLGVTCLAGTWACDPAGGPSGHWLQIYADATTGSSTTTRPKPDAGPCPEPTLEAIRDEIFSPKCAVTGCHVTGVDPPKEDLDLSLPLADLRARLTQAAMQSPSGLPLIGGNDLGASYLYLKVFLTTPVAGERMPPRQPLERCEIDAIRDWIRAGASD